MFEKLVNYLNGAGLDAEENSICAGQYYDGADHGELFPVVRVETDLSVPFSLLDGICKRRGLVYDWRSCWGCGVRIYTIWRADDREKARRLDDTARAFSDAFWMAIHLDNSARENDSAGAIAAGRRAVAMLNWLDNGRA